MSKRGGVRFTEEDFAQMQRRVRGVTPIFGKPEAPRMADLVPPIPGAGLDLVPSEPQKAPKYHNVAVTDADGVTHDSSREARRWAQLQLLEKAGAIRDLQRQVYFELAPAVDLGEPRIKPALRYKADFVYTDCATGKKVVEDAKGVQTPLYRAKKHLMATVHGIIIQEV